MYLYSIFDYSRFSSRGQSMNHSWPYMHLLAIYYFVKQPIYPVLSSREVQFHKTSTSIKKVVHMGWWEHLQKNYLIKENCISFIIYIQDIRLFFSPRMQSLLNGYVLCIINGYLLCIINGYVLCLLSFYIYFVIEYRLYSIW